MFLQGGAVCCPIALGLLFRSSWTSLGRLWSPTWSLLGASWSVLGSSWSVLGASWSQLGASWAPLGANLEPLGRLLGATWSLLGASGPPLGPSNRAPVVFHLYCPRGCQVQQYFICSAPRAAKCNRRTLPTKLLVDGIDRSRLVYR